MLLLEVAAKGDIGTDKSGQTFLTLVNYLSREWDVAWFWIALGMSVALWVLGKIFVWTTRKSLLEVAKHNSKFTPMLYSLTSRVVSVIIWVLIALFILQCWGIDLTPILAGLGITGVVLGFALQESVSSFFSGLMLAVNRPFRTGDFVDIGGVTGIVMAMDAMCVTLASPDNKKIVLNNKNVWGNTIINFSFTSTRRVDFTVSVEYGSDLEKVKETILNLLKSYPEVLEKPETLVEINNYSNNSIDFVARPWVNTKDYWLIYWRFNGQIYGELGKAGIKIPFNQVDIHISNKDVLDPVYTSSELPPGNLGMPRPSMEATAAGMGTEDAKEILKEDEEKSKNFFHHKNKKDKAEQQDK